MAMNNKQFEACIFSVNWLNILYHIFEISSCQLLLLTNIVFGIFICQSLPSLVFCIHSCQSLLFLWVGV